MSILLFVLLGSFAVLLVAVKWRMNEDSTGSTNRPELWQVMIQDLTLDDMKRQRGKVSKWLLLAAFCAWGLSSFFLVKYMTGGTMNPLEWDAEQWLNAFFALLLTAIITVFQYFLYSINQKGPAAFIGVVVCVFFGLFSEISNSMEREGATVRARSEDSSVFQATVNAIGSTSNAATVTTSPALITAEQAKAKALIEIEACERHRSRGQARVDKCLRIERGNLAAAQATISAIKSGNTEAVAANHNQALALVDKAKSLSFDEAQHFEIIKLMKDWLGIAAIAASFLFSLIIMGTFEYAFHYLAVYFAALKKAIKAIAASEAIPAAPVEPEQTSGSSWGVSPAVGVGVGVPVGDTGLGVGAGVVAAPKNTNQGFVGFVNPSAELPARPIPGRTGKYNPKLGRSDYQYSMSLDNPIHADSDTRVSPRTVHAATANTDTRVSPRTVHAAAQGEAFTDGLYEELKQKIVEGAFSPTSRPVKTFLKDRQVGASDKARQLVAAESLDRLFSDGVLVLNPANDGTGINKAKYIINPEYQA